ncbi:hypothetical protein [Pseudomonas fluorescens]|uniref:Uncharacterized protein n=1 Tax=Pseudomonas fluorescens TaxID=294 RepID=A0A5E7S753_PSEFL|nr:hypothetical protein [Pseudomonas fluorescens]VVP78943.1 hypothetical protein PS928_00528 [Pseudomonas fluorescens]
MTGGPLADPRAAATADIERKKADFFKAGGKASIAPGYERAIPPVRSDKIDPDTILRRRRPSLTRAERMALQRITEAI